MALTDRTQLVLKTKLGDERAASEIATAIAVGGGGGIENQIVQGVTTIAPAQDIVYTSLAAKQDIPTLNSNVLLRANNAGEIAGFNSVTIDEANANALSVSGEAAPDNESFKQWNRFFLNIRPLQDSPNEGWSVHSVSAFYDPDNSGFSMGTAGTAIILENLYMNHVGSGDLGTPTFINMNADLGNGVDAITVRGLSFSMGFSQVHEDVTLDGPVQGYIFQPNFDPTVLTTSNHYNTSFGDFLNMPSVASGPYTSFNSSPTIGSIKNNANYNALSINPSITTFTGNAGANVIGIYGNYGTFDTGGWNGIFVNPTITSIVNATGLYINMDSVNASGNKKAIDVKGDVSIDGNMSFTGALSIGQLQAFYATNPVDGGGNPQNLHGLTTSMTALNGVTTANCDAIGVNTAMLISLQANSINTSGAFKLGFAALALPCVVETHTGSSIDHMNAAVYAINLAGTSTGGTIDNLNLCRAVVIPNGITTITNVRGFYVDAPFGQVGVTNWGFYDETDSENFFKQSLKIGGTPGSTDVVTNSSVALEIESTTRAFVPSRMTSTQRDALTAIDGMVLYNTTTDKLQVRAAATWIDLH